MSNITNILARRIPQLHASVARVYGDEAKLWGINLDRARFAELCKALDAGPHDGTAHVMLKGLKIVSGPTLEPETITVVVSVAGGLLCRAQRR